MKKIFSFILICAGATAYAQPKTISQAIITTKTVIASPDGEDDAPPPPPPGGEGGGMRMTMRFGGDGETKSITTIKGDLVKTFIETEMNRTTTIRDNAKKMTTTIMEMMGSKNGFYSTDADQEEMRKRMDSLMQGRSQNNQSGNMRALRIVSTEIVYTEETKKIAGQMCKKAMLIGLRENQTKDTSTVWYCPDFTIQGVKTTGGLASTFGFGFGSRNNNNQGSAGFMGLAGFPMKYEMKMPRGRTMTVEVTKIVLDKEIADKEFEIPKDVTLKNMKDMQNGGGDGRVMIRMGGPEGH